MFDTYSAAAPASLPICFISMPGKITRLATSVAINMRLSAGISRRMRRAQKRARFTPPVARPSARRFLVMRYPEITKNTSTPTKPPEKPGMCAWYATTRTIAIARIPSMSGRKAPRAVPSLPPAATGTAGIAGGGATALTTGSVIGSRPFSTRRSEGSPRRALTTHPCSTTLCEDAALYAQCGPRGHASPYFQTGSGAAANR
jgi:hypothetical protein